MIKLVKLLTEIENKAKVIIMAGGAGAGKSTLINKFKSSVPDFELINPDKYVEDEDHPFHNNLKHMLQTDNINRFFYSTLNLVV